MTIEVENAPHTPRPIVAIVGRPNVGKSTLFNRLVGKRTAIVEDVPGVTRDRNYADADWDGKPMTLVDTGGFLPEGEDQLMAQVRDQANLAIDEAQAVILVVDGMAGATTPDVELARMLRKSGKPLFLAVNKIDSTRREEEEFFTEFFRLGIEKTFAVSAEHGRGIGALMDAVAESFPKGLFEEPEQREGVCRVAIVGRPNVGKSTFVNRVLGEERMVTSEIAGTTRDPLDAELTHKGKEYVLTDTAGIRRKRSIAAKVEQYSVMRALQSIERADVVVLMLDAKEPAVEQDAKIAEVALEKGRAILLVVNKWDLISHDAKTVKEFKNELLIRLPFLTFVPTVYVSALTGDNVFRVLELAGQLFEQFNARIPTPLLNQFFRKIVDEHPAPLASGGQPVRLFYIAQTGERPPTFNIQANRPNDVTEDYKRFIVNRMRESFGLQVPVRLIFRAKSKRQFVPKREPGEKRKGKGYHRKSVKKGRR